MEILDPKIKLLRFPEKIKGILDGNFQPPIMADVDVVSGLCNLKCEWCAQIKSQGTKKTVFMSTDTMKRMGKFCKAWGIKSWRLAGDSEPTLNPNLSCLLSSGSENGIDMGLITNGLLLDKVKGINLLRWIGISLDATTAETWSRFKHSSKENFYKIIENIKRIRQDFPEVEVSLKFIRWSEEVHLNRSELYEKDLNKFSGGQQKDNYSDALGLPGLAKELGCKYILHDAMPKHPEYKFKICRGTPLYATFGADHKFYLCCDVRTGYILTDDYTRGDWRELYDLWGSEKHKNLLVSINPKDCKFCSKEWLNTIIENIVLTGEHSKDYQVNFI